MLIDKLAYSSKLAHISPRAKLGVGFFTLMVCLLANSFWVSVTTIAAMGITAICIAHVPFKQYIKLMSVPIVFLILGTVTIIIGSYEKGTELLLGFSGNTRSYGITVSSLMTGILLILRALGAVSCMYFISTTTPMNDILNALRSLKLPPLLVSLMELIYRYIFVILDEAQRMKTAQSSRLGFASFKTAIHSTGVLFGSLFLRVYMRCDRVYAALESRGYEGDFLVLDVEYKSPKGILFAALFLNLLLMVLWFLQI